MSIGNITKQIQAEDLKHIIHPFTDISARGTQGATVINRSEGVHVWDTDGNKYLDALGGLWCVNIGYGRKEMVEAISDQLTELPFYSMFDDLVNPPAANLSAKLAELAPGSLNHVMFTTGGSTAVDSAVRIIHHFFNRQGRFNKKHVIAREHGYHGSTYVSASITSPTYHDDWDVETNFVHHIQAPYVYRRPDGLSEEEFGSKCVQALENKILELGPEKVACFIAEPIMGSGGVIVPPKNYNRRTWELCQKYGVLYVADEVVTAFGRVGHMFASEAKFGIIPDIICCAKGISSGYLPLGAAIINDEIFDVISAPGSAFMHGFTYSGHPVCCAAGLKNIEILEREDICGQVRKTGLYFEQALKTLSDLPLVGDIRGDHFMMCIENVQNKETKEIFPIEVDIGKRIWRHCQERGVLLRPLRHLNVLSPPLIVTRSDIDQITEVLRESILTTQDELIREGLWSAK